jgi:exosome complex component RRP4
MKQIVIPGEVVSEERKRLGSNVFVSDGKIYSKVLGITDKENDTADVVALKGTYVPRRDDTVIGIVNRVVFAGYGVEINSFTSSFIPRKAMRQEAKLGDILVAKIEDVNELKEANLAYPKKLYDGEIIEIIPVRSPRLIGKNASMLDVLTNGTNCEIFIGKNGRVWAKDGNIELLKKAVQFINDNSYKSNLTNAVEELLKGEKK